MNGSPSLLPPVARSSASLAVIGCGARASADQQRLDECRRVVVAAGECHGAHAQVGSGFRPLPQQHRLAGTGRGHHEADSAPLNRVELPLQARPTDERYGCARHPISQISRRTFHRDRLP